MDSSVVTGPEDSAGAGADLLREASADGWLVDLNPVGKSEQDMEVGRAAGRGVREALMAEGSPRTVWVRTAGLGQSSGKHHIGNSLLGSIGCPSKRALGAPLVPPIFSPISDIRNPVQSNSKTPDSSSLKRILS